MCALINSKNTGIGFNRNSYLRILRTWNRNEESDDWFLLNKCDKKDAGGINIILDEFDNSNPKRIFEVWLLY